MKYFYRYIMTPMEFQDWKMGVIDATGLERDALHIYFGLAVFLVARVIFGRRAWSGPVAWLFVLIIAVMGEVLDYSGNGNVFAIFTVEVHSHDIINTLFSPTVLLLFGPVIFARARPKPAPLADQAGDQGLK